MVALNKLNKQKIDRIIREVNAGEKPTRLGDGSGLWLSVRKNGASWIYRWTPKGGKPREMGIGAYPTVSLAIARDKAGECRQIVAKGLDPKVERDKVEGVTFGEAGDAFYQAKSPQWTGKKTLQGWQNTLLDKCAPIRATAIADLNTEHVLKVLNPIWIEKPETAQKVRSRIEAICDFAKAKGWREGENPARWRGHLQNILPKPQKLATGHHAAMEYQDLPDFMERLGERDAMASLALQFTILTVSRTSETLLAEWSEIDLENAIWTLPAVRMKSRKEHRVPLSESAMQILHLLGKDKAGDFIFSGQRARRPLSQMAMMMLMRRMGRGDLTVHGFRSTFRDWAGDQTSFARETVEECLAHSVGNVVERAYRRGDAIDKRRRVLEAWSDYCLGDSHAKVVPLHG